MPMGKQGLQHAGTEGKAEKTGETQYVGQM